jgi:hypothetical protein
VVDVPELNLGNGYQIDLADGWTFVHALEDAINQLTEAWTVNSHQIAAPPPGNDGHSQTFSNSMTQNAVQKHEAWYFSQIQKLNTMRDNVTGVLQQYGITETANTIQWNSTSDDSAGSVPNQGKGGGRGAM